MSESTDTDSTAQERLVTALAEMEQWEDVWMELYVRGVTGVLQHGSECPVARYLASRVGEEVGLIGDAVFEMGGCSLTPWTPVPGNVTEFIREFDWNRYPELESA